MMRRRYAAWSRLPYAGVVIAAWWWAGLGTASAAEAVADAAYRAAFESIQSSDLKRDVYVLAADDKAGRGSGTPGAQAAAEYIRSRFLELKLAPAGDDGYFQKFSPHYCNVLAKLEGSDPALKREFVIVGGHYDHVGRGEHGGGRGARGQIHPGADDNAGGVAGVLELAQAMATLPTPPRRTVVFACWDGEERGLLGSTHWTTHPTLPIDQARLAVNLDMIGRMRGEQLSVIGTRTGYGLRRLVCRHNEAPPFQLDFPWALHGNSDHYPPALLGKVPTLMFHTGPHDDLHRPSDRPERLDYGRMQGVVRLVFAVMHDAARCDACPRYREEGAGETEAMRQEFFSQNAALPERLGISWDACPTPGEERGLRVTQIAPGSSAAKAGLVPDDRILQFAGREIRTDDDLIGAVMTAPATTTALVVKAGGGSPREISLQLTGPALRFGFLWLPDDAEPGTVVLVRIVPGSPAARAGLMPMDRILGFDGREFADEASLSRGLDRVSGGVRLRIERCGSVRTVELQLGSGSVRRAA